MNIHERHNWFTKQIVVDIFCRSSGQTPSLYDKCTGLFYVHYTTHRTNGCTSNPKDEAMVKDLGVMAGDLIPHSANQKHQSLNLVLLTTQPRHVTHALLPFVCRRRNVVKFRCPLRGGGKRKKHLPLSHTSCSWIQSPFRLAAWQASSGSAGFYPHAVVPHRSCWLFRSCSLR